MSRRVLRLLVHLALCANFVKRYPTTAASGGGINFRLARGEMEFDDVDDVDDDVASRWIGSSRITRSMVYKRHREIETRSYFRKRLLFSYSKISQKRQVASSLI